MILSTTIASVTRYIGTEFILYGYDSSGLKLVCDNGYRDFDSPVVGDICTSQPVAASAPNYASFKTSVLAYGFYEFSHADLTNVTVNAARVRYLVSLGASDTRIHFDKNRFVDVNVAIATVRSSLSSVTGWEPVITAGTTAQYWRGDKSWQTLDKSAVGLGNVDNTSDANKPVSTAQATAIGLKVTANGAITGATKTKITYDSKGLVTAGTDATTADIADSANKRYVTDAQLTVIGNTSGTNSGNETTSTLGATINGAAAATPNDTDLVATVESSVVKKITWTNVKAFLKTYFDTLYEKLTNKDATGGYVGLTLFKINFKNAANTFTSFFTNSNSAARTYTFQNRDGTIADDTDLALKANLASPTFTGTVLAANIQATGSIITNDVGIGYYAGAGGTATQGTSRTTTVVLNKLCGTIQMFSAAQASDAVVTFTFTNSFIGADDYLCIQHAATGANGGAWAISTDSNAGSATISVRNVSGGSITEATLLRFFVFKTADT